MSKVKQPDWCCYPDAGEPFLGCWSLWLGMVKDESFCVDCDCYIRKEINNEQDN